MSAPAAAPPALPAAGDEALGPATAPSAAMLVDVWEEASEQPPAWRAVVLLRAGHPDRTALGLAGLPVGRRDAALLDLRAQIFGDEWVCLADCPGCGDVQELRFRTADIRVDAPRSEDRSAVSAAGWTVEFRLPTTADVAAVAVRPGAADLDVAATALLRRCVVRVRRAGRDASPDRLPAPVREEVARRMSEMDPQAEVALRLRCPCCAQDWTVLFDVGEHLWQEVDAWAHRLLGDVHVLASVYGWTEAEVLALSPRRRRFYLEAVGA